MGLTVRVKPPGYAARLELLQLAADRRGTELDLSSAKRISRKVEGTAPQLFQALTRLDCQRTRANLDRDGFDRDDSKQATNRDSLAKVSQLHDEPRHETFPWRENITIRQILAVVARYFSVSQTQLRSHSRRRTIVHARGVVVYLTRMLTALSYAQIGQALGNRDHTTTMHAHRKLQHLFATDPLTQEYIEDLTRIITAA
jgi:chromosomal replication initiator protein